MEFQDIVESVTIKPPQPSQDSRPSRVETWSMCKHEIYRVYMTEGNTLTKTMEVIEREFGLKACTRTWKAKLKEWKFDMYITQALLTLASPSA